MNTFRLTSTRDKVSREKAYIQNILGTAYPIKAFLNVSRQSSLI